MTDLAAIAACVNTGSDNHDTSRALVVFNLTRQPVSGIAVFHAAMSWPRSLPLPPVLVTNEDISVPSVVHDMTEGPDAKGRPDRRQFTFSLAFAVADVPADGWCTYIAAYTDTPSPGLEDFGEHFVATPGLVVVETTRHSGSLPPIGSGLGNF